MILIDTRLFHRTEKEYWKMADEEGCRRALNGAINDILDESISAVKRAMPDNTHTRRVVIREITLLKVEK